MLEIAPQHQAVKPKVMFLSNQQVPIRRAPYDRLWIISVPTVFGAALNVLEPGERFYEFVVDTSKADVPLAKLSESKEL